MTFFTQEALREKNNTLLIITVVIILIFSMYVLILNDDLLGVLISLCLVIVCGLITILMVE
jgi:hypothetical protein